MFSNAAKPIGSISVIRFAAMHDAMNERAGWIGNSLGDFVRCVEMVVPQQHERDDKVPLFGLNTGIAQCLVEALLQFSFGFYAWARAGPKLWGLQGFKEFLNLLFGSAV